VNLCFGRGLVRALVFAFAGRRAVALLPAGLRLADFRLAWTFLCALAIDVSLNLFDWSTAAQVMEEPEKPAIRIFVDADACPVKSEIYRVAERYGLKVFVVANSFMNVPRSDLIERVVVSEGPDIADNWIAEWAGENDIVITADIPLAGRCVRKGATVIGPTGKPFTDDSIGMALATRDLLTDLRSAGATTRGPPPLSRQDISRFLSALDLAVTRLQRKLNPSS
jgi:uncharacterized protein YaiI (UPF0178 family)